MISVAQADLRYQLCRTRALRYRDVDHGLFQDFSERTNHLHRLLGAIERDEGWDQFVRALRRYRYELAAAPLAFGDPWVARRTDVVALNRFVEMARTSHPRLAGPARDLVELLLQLRSSSDNPLMDGISAILGPEPRDHAGVVLADSRLVRPTREVFQALPATRRVEVITADTLRRADSYDLLVVLGPARWFPDYVFSSPQAGNIAVVSYAWLRSRWRSSRTFLAPTVAGVASERNPEEDAGDDVDDVRLEFDWTRIERRSTEESEAGDGDDEQDLIEARLYALQDDYAVFLEATHRRTTLVIDLDADEDDRVAQVADDDIEPGMFVVLRNDESGDYIVPLANKMLGNRAASYRADHARWKKALRDQVRLDGLQVTSLLLMAAGATRPDPTNLRHWMSERNIAPQSEDDFVAITRLVGLEGEARHLWMVAGAVRRAHLRAGMEIRRRLIERVRTANVSELEARGRMDFELPEAEGGRLAAFRIEGRSSSTTVVSIARIERVFRPED